VKSKDEVLEEALTGAFVGAPVILIEMLGMAPAVMLRQIKIFSECHDHEHDGHHWTYNSLKSWSRVTGISVDQVRYALDKLANKSLILRTDKYNNKPYDHTLWYAVNREALRDMVNEFVNIPPDPPRPSSHEKAEQNRALEDFRKGSGNVE